MVPSKKIIFRADAGSLIGMGHFIRTLALAEMLNDDFYCVFATRSPTKDQIEEIDKICRKRMDLPNDETHFKTFLDLLEGGEIVVLDNYYFNTEYQRQIKKKGCKLVCIDDLHDKHFVSDCVINQAEGTDPACYSKEQYTKLLLGLKYALLRSSFFSECKPIGKKTFSCMIMIGGADPENITLKILKNIDSTLPVAIVLGNSYQNIEDIECFKNVRIFQGVSAEQVVDLMNNSDFGIFPASSVSIEACATRMPFICGYFIENQQELYNGIKTNELAVCIDDLKEVNKQKLSAAIKKIEDPSVCDIIVENQIKCLDKKSNVRLKKIFQEL
jgi:UDP-2,4-diacetamido-2,4,6-trideoxy-beta-L-altropyranose hydrolase